MKNSVLHEYDQRATPAVIAVSFPSLRIEDIYVAFTYYLNHHDKLEEYLRQQEVAGVIQTVEQNA